MKKLLIVSTIIAIMCVCLVGCIDDDKPVEITATATTVQSIGEVKASDYNDGYHTNDYFIAVLLTTENVEAISLLNEETNTYNFMLLMSDGDELMEAIKPIDTLFGTKDNEYALVFHSNYTLEEYDFALSINVGGKHEVVKLGAEK
mgnify:CR=1 FL=1